MLKPHIEHIAEYALMPGIPFELKPGRWYAWEMLPGYLAQGRQMEPYYSPVLIHSVEPLKSGKNLLQIRLLNACYSSGVAESEVKLQVLARRYHFLMAAIHDDSERCVIVSDISFAWVEKFCPQLFDERRLQSEQLSAEFDINQWLENAFR